MCETKGNCWEEGCGLAETGNGARESTKGTNMCEVSNIHVRNSVFGTSNKHINSFKKRNIGSNAFLSGQNSSLNNESH